MELIKSSAYQVRSITSIDSSVVAGDRRSLDWIWSKSTCDRMVGEWGDLGFRLQDFCFVLGQVQMVCANGLWEKGVDPVG
jgi:hypothetical protein